MTKYWNASRVRRVRERKARAAKRSAERATATKESQRSYMAGDARKNAGFMLDALGVPLRRRMIARLKRGGAMSVSKLVEPYNITLPSALAHVRALERSGIITTHKHGRVRLCVYRHQGLKELVARLASGKLD